MFKKLSVLTQTHHQRDLTKIAISSFEKYRPLDLEIEYIIVEGSDDTTYKNEIEKLSSNVRWFNNSSSDSNDPIENASDANGLNIEYGKKHITSEWVFVCHNDVAVCSESFFKILKKYSNKYDLIACCRDNSRVKAGHISGLLIKNEILQKVDCRHKLPEIDVGDNLSIYCRNNHIKTLILPNTHNNPEIWNNITGLWHNIGKDCGVDRCIVNNEVIFCHLGRGTPKSLNKYYKVFKITHDEWKLIHEEFLK